MSLMSENFPLAILLDLLATNSLSLYSSENNLYFTFIPERYLC